jgi:hypothetical protein
MGANHKASLLMRFIGGQVGKSNKSIMLFRFLGIPHGFELFEGNIHNQDELPNGVLVGLGFRVCFGGMETHSRLGLARWCRWML